MDQAYHRVVITLKTCPRCHVVYRGDTAFCEACMRRRFADSLAASQRQAQRRPSRKKPKQKKKRGKGKRQKRVKSPLVTFLRLKLHDSTPLMLIGISPQRRRQLSYLRSAAFTFEQRRGAQMMAQEAVRAGYIVRWPCVIPGCGKTAVGHHPDYSQPLKVIWLCGPHHWEEHGYTEAEVQRWGWKQEHADKVPF